MSVIFVGALDKYFLKVAAELIGRGVPISCFFDRFNEPGKKSATFRDVNDIDARQFIYPEHIYKLNVNNEEVLSEAFIGEFCRAETVFLSISDRFSINMSVLERKRLFRELLLYFYTFLKKGSWEAIIFPNAPHAGWNSVLYFVAKYLGVRTLVLEYTRINDRMVVWEDYERVEKVPEGYLAGVSKEGIMAQIDPNIYSEVFGGDEGEWMKNSNRMNVNALVQGDSWGEGIAFARRLVKAMVAVWQRKFSGRYEDERRPMLLNDPPNEVVTVVRKYLTDRKYNHLRQYYKARIAPVDYSRPYVLFFLNYQPEKTTTPLGGVYDDQILAIRTLVRAVPKDWLIYVKEHPRQFSGVLDSEPYRDRRFYERIADLPRVSLVSVDEASDKLMERAQSTATITGSIGWQGMLKGKPCILFGVSWYSPCRSCYNVKSLLQCREAVVDIQTKLTGEVELDVLRYLSFANDDLLLGSNNETFARRSSRSLDELAAGLAEGLAQRLVPQRSSENDKLVRVCSRP